MGNETKRTLGPHGPAHADAYPAHTHRTGEVARLACWLTVALSSSGKACPIRAPASAHRTPSLRACTRDACTHAPPPARRISSAVAWPGESHHKIHRPSRCRRGRTARSEQPPLRPSSVGEVEEVVVTVGAVDEAGRLPPRERSARGVQVGKLSRLRPTLRPRSKQATRPSLRSS